MFTFTPTRAALEAAIGFFAKHPEGTGGAVGVAARRAAFARYEAAPGDLKLPYHDVRWISGRMTLPTSPIDSVALNGAEEVDRPALVVKNAGGLVHLGATCLQGPSSAREDARVVVMPLADAVRSHAEMLAKVRYAIVRRRGGRFTALATAFQNCGAFVYVPEGVVLDDPIQLVWVHGSARTEAVFPHIVVVLGAGAKATVIERHVGEGDAFVCGVSEASVGAGARLEYVVVQQTGDGVRARMTRAARCERDARVGWHLAELGGAYARTILNAQLDAQGAHANISALFLNTGTRQVELASSAEHRSAQTSSTTVVRGAASDRGRGRYIGTVRIAEAAHGSSASLRGDALLLSRHARVDVRPELEIRANEVSAFHGTTIGSLDEDALFYAQARGIARSEAVRMIALAFFEPAVLCFPGADLQDEVRTALDHAIDRATDLEA